jgi:hypothetical protein
MNCSRQSKGLNSFKGVVDFNLHKDRDHMETTLEQGGNMDRGIELWGLDQVIEIAHMGVLEQEEIQATLVDPESTGMFRHSQEALFLVTCKLKAQIQGWQDLEKDLGLMGMQEKPLLVSVALVDLVVLQTISHQ